MLGPKYPHPNGVRFVCSISEHVYLLPLLREGVGEIADTRNKRLRMLRSQHTLSCSMHLAVDLLRLSMLPLAREGEAPLFAIVTVSGCSPAVPCAGSLQAN